MKIVFQIVIVSSISLFLGLIWNQINPRGIPCRLLWTQVHSGTLGEQCSLDINQAFMLSLNDSVQFVDLRPESEFNIDHIQNAISVPWLNVIRHTERLDSLSVNRTYILYTFHSEGAPCKAVAGLMKEHGFEDVFILREGFASWLDLGFPVELGVDG